MCAHGHMPRVWVEAIGQAMEASFLNLPRVFQIKLMWPGLAAT